MNGRIRPWLQVVALILAAPLVQAQNAERMKSQTGPVTTIGQRNPPLYDGAQALLAGNVEEGVRLTHEGLKMALGKREEEAALSNLCAGYIRLRKLDTAMEYCEMLLQRNENHWRGYNNRAVIYLEMKEYEKADQDLKRAEELNPGARTVKVARAIYMDAVYPVAPAVEIDDRQRRSKAESEKDY
ncbi:MAG: tetratricopeptide repeat protein [Gammaproteobacteria bacterium]|nr:tetratricopeptide repeat protein [Gammaproteobacteria bacterium]MDH4315289.1 tetratricopeptide repeat protein [Gammaproteobacteria bacterium]MDH5213945.1 tetratricopeptide repeat protein [Gammaproteobacteria bacterium]MDH5499589.1 tetratricopeptide repeat protein [Gammaproteobacteria bacterium]